MRVDDFPDLDAPGRRGKDKTPSLIGRSLRPHWRTIVLLVIALIAQSATTVSLLRLMVSMIDDGVVDRSRPLNEFVATGLATTAGIFVAAIFTGYLVRKLSFVVEFDLRTWLYLRLQSADLADIGQLTSGQLVTRSIADLNFVQQVIGLIPLVIAFVPIVIGGGILLTVLNPVMGLTSMAALTFNIVMTQRISPALRALSAAELNERGEVTAAIDEPVRGIRVVHAFRTEAHEERRVGDAALRVYRWAMARARLLARFDLLLRSLPVVVNASMLYVGARLVADDRLTLGTFTLAFGLVTALSSLAGYLDTLVSLWQYFLAAQRRLTQVLRLPPARQGTATAPDEPSDLEVAGVAVERDGAIVFADFNLTARAGAVTLVAGPPGSGKSTVAALAAGVLHPTAGRVAIGDVAVSDLSPTEIGRAVRVVAEESFLFAGTVRDNLQMAASGACTDADLLAAVYAAGAEDVLADLPGGLDRPVGERGLTLSGGQRQRLALARALVSPPRVLVLDDALSAVQPALEVEVLKRIRAYAPDLALVLVTRRGDPGEVADATYTLPARQASTTGPAVNGDRAAAAAVAADSIAADFIASLGLSPRALAALQRLSGAIAKANDPAPVGTQTIGGLAPPTVRSAIVVPFRRVLLLSTGALLLLASGDITPKLLLGAVSDLARDHNLTAIDVRVVIVALVGAAAAGGAYAFNILSQRLIQGIVYLLRLRLFRRLCGLGTSYFDREQPGQIAARVVNDIDQLTLFLSTSAKTLAINLAQMVVGLTAMIVIAPTTAPLVLGLVAGVVVVCCVQAVVSARVMRRARDHLGIVTARFEEDLTGTLELRNLGAGPAQSARFIASGLALRRSRAVVAWTTALFSASMLLLGNTAVLLVTRRAGEAVFAGAITVGAALSMRVLTDAVTSPIPALTNVYAQLLDVRVSWHRLGDPFREPVLPVERENAVVCPDLRGTTRFEDVGFAYPSTDRPVLHELSFELAPGRVTAIVGYTGAGKSSLSKLLTRVYDPDAGSVSVDGVDLRAWTLDSYRQRVGVVPQDAFVFKGTIASNIAYGRADAPRDEIEQAARAVGADAVIGALPGGYDHPVEEAGANLTAAQRQLVALARAWMTAPDLLILDEATSALDVDLERAVVEAVRRLGCTTVTVTHREPVVAMADSVLVLDGGRLVQQGTPAEVLAEGGAFAALWAPAVKR